MAPNTDPRDSAGDRLSEVKTELELMQLDMDDEILEASLHEYQRYLDQLDAARSHLDQLLTATSATLDQLSDISKSFKTVNQQTSAFKKQSATVLDEQRHNEKLAKDLSENLAYYEPLERITRRMNAPNVGNFVRTQDFRDMLITLDECIDYMITHPAQKEAELYRSRYKQLLTRALTLVRNTFMAGARDITNDVAKKLADKHMSETIVSSQLYAKFRVDAPAMKDLGLEIQKRAVLPADAEIGAEPEYQSLMNELHQAFALCRTKLILPIVQQRLSEFTAAPGSTDLASLARSCITYIRGVCLDEFELWSEWFHGYRGVYDFLELICEPLYDLLRPRIIHENKLSKLCALVTFLQTRYLNDEEDDDVPDLNQLNFAALIQPALEDAQSRLVFRALALLRDEIEYFKPSPDDLDYPRRITQPSAKPTAPLSGRKSASKLAAATAAEDDSDNETATTTHLLTRTHLLDTAYPTLARCIRLLSRIYRLVHTHVFDDLAHQIVHQTTLSLVNASNQISTKHSPSDAQLFLLRHLLLLKNQIVAFDIEYVSTPEVSFDFSGLTSTFYEIRSRGALFNPASWMRLFSTRTLLPQVVENMLDAKVELDGQLRTVINAFTANFGNIMSGPLKQAKKQPEVAAREAREMVEKEVPILRAKLEQYLEDLRTRETLVAAVEEVVVQNYETFFEEFAATETKGAKTKGKANGSVGGKISRKGKGNADAVWDGETFAEWAETVFNVAMPQGLANDDDDDDDNGSDSRSVSRSRSS